MPDLHGSHVAVNVKVRADWYSPEAAAEFPGLTREWIARNLDASAFDGWWSEACQVGWDRAEDLARKIWGHSAKVYSESPEVEQERRPVAASLLIEQGSDPEFFQLTETGEDIEEED